MAVFIVLRFVRLTVALFLIPVVAAPTAYGQSSPTVSDLQQLASRVNSSTQENLRSAIANRARAGSYAHPGGTIEDPGEPSSPQSAFDTYVQALQDVGWTQNAQTLLVSHPELIRNYQISDAQANTVVDTLRQLGDQDVTLNLVKSTVNEISASDRESLLSEIQSLGIAQTLRNHSDGDDSALSAPLHPGRPAGRSGLLRVGLAGHANEPRLVTTLYSAALGQPRLLRVRRAACDIIAIEVFLGVITGNELVAGLGGLYLYFYC